MTATIDVEVEAEPTQLCTFFLDGVTYGLDVRHVQEVLRHPALTVVPGAPEAVLGVANLRGNLVTAIDLRRRLGLPPRTTHRGELMSVVVRTKGEVQSLIVDEIGDVLDTSDLTLRPVPAHLPRRVSDVARGVYSLPGAVLLVLDPERTVEVAP